MGYSLRESVGSEKKSSDERRLFFVLVSATEGGRTLLREMANMTLPSKVSRVQS